MYDIAIIGGGINGCGIARDAAGRGYSVLLAESGDLASGTSSRSTGLIHGGLRYLEQYRFRLVREALRERERLWAMAPHVIAPARFVLPHHAGLRPAWMLRLGLLVYDHIGGRRRLPATKALDLRADAAGAPLQPDYTKGFEYSDARVDDARLVVLNARDAAGRGAEIRPRTPVLAARRERDHWRLELRDEATGAETSERARLLVNAAGPWADIVRNKRLGQAGGNLRLVQGSHIVVPKLFDHDRGYLFQNSDGRIVFALPFEADFTLIGTTDLDCHGDPGAAAITPDETDYLCQAASGYFREPVTPEQVVWSFSGVRALHDEGSAKAQAATRDYVLSLEGETDEPALVTVFGGKITIYRKLAEAVLEKVESRLGARGPRWSATTPLPGGDFPVDGLAGEIEQLRAGRPWLEESLARRLVRAYGTLARELLEGARQLEDLGAHFGAGLYQREVEYLLAHEWAHTPEDILWRRTKLGLKLSEQEKDRLAAWLHERHARIAKPAG